MNMSNGAVLVAAGLIAGVGITFGVLSKQSPQTNQAQVSVPQPVTSPAAVQQVQQTHPQPQQADRLETEKAVFQNVQITRYTGEPPEGVDVAGELYQVTVTITNRTNELLTPSFSYHLRDDQGRKFEKAAFLIGLGDDGVKTNNGILAGQTRAGVIIGVFDVLPGATGLELGVTDGMFATTHYVSPPLTQPLATQPTAAVPVLVSSPVPVPAPVPAPAPAPTAISFDALTPCDQLDSIARAGKSVSEFLVAAHRVSDLAKYEAAIAATCPWNAEQLAVADRIINPPVIVVEPRVIRHGSSGSTVVIREQPAGGWNNCNGIQEPGESYSVSCHRAQVLNDVGLGNEATHRKDERQHWGMPANGYSADPQ